MAKEKEGRAARSFRYLTRSIAKLLKRGQLAEGRVDADFADLAHSATAAENAREDEEDDDLEDGWKLEYPPARAVDSAPPRDTPPLTVPTQDRVPGGHPHTLDELEVTSTAPSGSRKRKRRGKKTKKSEEQSAPSQGNPSETSPAAEVCEPPTLPEPHKTHAQLGKQKRRAKKRRAAYPSSNPSVPIRDRTQPSTYLRKRSLRVLGLKKDAHHLKHARGSYIGLRQPVDKTYMTLEEAIAAGHRVIKWDGKDTLVILDCHGRIIAFGVGAPTNDQANWDRNTDAFLALLQEVEGELKFGRADRRGSFKTIAIGTSFGGGQKRPGMLKQRKGNEAAVQKLLTATPVIRVAHHQNTVFATFAPKMYAKYCDNAEALQEHFPDLKSNFANSVFPACSFNFPPHSFSRMHNDHGNRAAGFCPIFCAGKFDHSVGGHLVLEDFGLVIEFPSGSTLAIPSASCRHGNIPVRSHESRASFTQYAAGGLFRYVEYGFKTWQKYKASLTTQELHQYQVIRENRWIDELTLFSKIDELRGDLAQRGVPDE